MPFGHFLSPFGHLLTVLTISRRPDSTLGNTRKVTFQGKVTVEGLNGSPHPVVPFRQKVTESALFGHFSVTFRHFCHLLAPFCHFLAGWREIALQGAGVWISLGGAKE